MASTAPPERGRVWTRGRHFVGPLILLVAGVLLLLNNLQVVPWSIWQSIWPYWPLLLVLLGVEPERLPDLPKEPRAPGEVLALERSQRRLADPVAHVQPRTLYQLGRDLAAMLAVHAEPHSLRPTAVGFQRSDPHVPPVQELVGSSRGRPRRGHRARGRLDHRQAVRNGRPCRGARPARDAQASC